MNVSYLARHSRPCSRSYVSKVYKNVVKTTQYIKTRREAFSSVNFILERARNISSAVTFSRSEQILITPSLQRKKKREKGGIQAQNETYLVCMLWLKYSGNLIIVEIFKEGDAFL